MVCLTVFSLKSKQPGHRYPCITNYFRPGVEEQVFKDEDKKKEVVEMPEGLDVIIVDDDPDVCEVITEIVKRFYTWGDVVSFSNVDKAIEY